MLGFCRQDCSKIEEKQNNEKHKLKLKECHKESKLEICKVFNLEAMAKAAAAMTKADRPFGVAWFRVVVVAVGSSNAKATRAAPGATSAGQLNIDLKSFDMCFFWLFNGVFVWFCTFFRQGTWGNFLQQKIKQLKKLLRIQIEFDLEGHKSAPSLAHARSTQPRQWYAGSLHHEACRHAHNMQMFQHRMSVFVTKFVSTR